MIVLRILLYILLGIAVLLGVILSMRLKIYINGVTYKADESDLDAICIYENNERFSTREVYTLNKREEYTGA